MKRLLLGLCILALLPLGAFAAAHALDVRLSAIELDDPARAAELWQSVRPLAASLADHDRLEQIDLAFADYQESPEAARELRLLLRNLSEAEKPYFYNFL